MNTTMKDKYDNELHVTMLVVARATLSVMCDTAYLTAGTVYPAGFLNNGLVGFIDNDNELTSFEDEYIIRLNTSDDWRRVDMAYNKAGFSCGDIVPVKTFIEGRKILAGCVWCLNQSGKWIALPVRNLTKIKVRVSAQALVARMKSTNKAGNHKIITRVTEPVVVGLEVCTGAGSRPGTTINFMPLEHKTDNVVRVEFTKGGRLYTYRLPAGMKAQPGDDAVVIVNNPAYPELKGTKVVRVKEVDTAVNFGGSYKYVEHIVSNEAERAAKKEEAKRKVRNKIDKKRIEVIEAHTRTNRLELELTKLVEDFDNGNY